MDNKICLLARKHKVKYKMRPQLLYTLFAFISHLQLCSCQCIVGQVGDPIYKYGENKARVLLNPTDGINAPPCTDTLMLALDNKQYTDYKSCNTIQPEWTAQFKNGENVAVSKVVITSSTTIQPAMLAGVQVHVDFTDRLGNPTSVLCNTLPA